eukprot:scaffold25629_cov33-Tisochrysis_lutea.AAC.2
MCHVRYFGSGVGGGGRRAFWLVVTGRRIPMRLFVGARPRGFPHGWVVRAARLPGCQGAILGRSNGLPFHLSCTIMCSIPSLRAIVLSVRLGASVSLSITSKREERAEVVGSLTSTPTRFFGCRPMSAWALLDASEELPKCTFKVRRFHKSGVPC